jgi:hypothetical protein
LSIAIETQTSWKNEWTAWREWRSAVESIGVLVFQFPSVPLAEVRGVALPHFPVPAVGINSRESAPAARVFTLVHEVVHLALSRAQEEDVALREKRSDTQWLEVERFAEEVASRVLVPGAGWANTVAAMPPRKGGFSIPEEKILGRAGRPLTQLVLEALDSNRITAVDASRYLDLRFDHFDGLRAELR